jgi:DUF4097 and DUF4098 domain-containing protein YvlB
LQGVSAVLRVPPQAVLDLRTSNGTVTVTGPTRNLHVETMNGPIKVTAGTGIIDLDTCNARIDIQAENAKVSASTCNSEITFSGSLAAGEHSLTNCLGRIQVTLPADARFAVDAATTLSGSVHTDFIASTTEILDQGILKATIGDSPQATIKLRTTTAPIDIRKKK